MALRIVRHDVTLMNCDAIVCPTDNWLSGAGGLDKQIILRGGPRLAEARKEIANLGVASTAITFGYDLPARYVIHTVGPVWRDGTVGEEKLLASCYTNCLYAALENNCKSIAIPLISSGRFGFPQERALPIALGAIGKFLMEEEMLVYLVVYDRASHLISQRLIEVKEYISDKYVALNASLSIDELKRDDDDNLLTPITHSARSQSAYSYRNYPTHLPDATEKSPTSQKAELCPSLCDDGRALFSECEPHRVEFFGDADESYSCEALSEKHVLSPTSHAKSERGQSLEEMIAEMKRRRFADTLFRFIDESGMTDVECYKRANVDKKTFSKIRCSEKYNPSRRTILAFAIALRLTLEKTQELLATVGYTLARSSITDVIVEFFITKGIYDIYEINETLFYYNQPILGS